MTEQEKAICVAWVKAHAHKWQVLNRARWKYQFHEKTLVRFVDAVQMREDEIPLILDYLASDDCIETLSLYDQAVDKSWKPTRAWLELSNRSAGNVYQVRLYHGLQTAVEGIADGPYLVEDGCVYKVSFTYYWKQAEVIPVPPSESGISYRITGINRDQDTGLYTYALEKRERVQQDVAEYFTSKSVYKDTTEEYHLGVRKDDVESTGKQASVANGVLVHRKITKNSDCTSDVHNTTEIEVGAPDCAENVSVSLTGTTKTTTHKNMPEKADTDNLGIGESVQNSKTPGGLWDQVIRTVVRNVRLWIRGACSKTIFKHTHSETIVQGEDPGFNHVVAAKDGIIKETNVSLTSDGSYQVTDGTVFELPVKNASRSAQMTLQGLTVKVENKNQPEPLSENGLKIGQSVSNTKTPGGLYDTVEVSAGVEPAGKISENCRQDYYVHRHSETENVSEPKEVEHPFEVGTIVSVNNSLNPNGTSNVTTTTDTAKPTIFRYHWRDDNGTHYVVKYTNQPTDGTIYLPAGCDQASVNDHVTEYGLHSGSVSWSDLKYKWRKAQTEYSFIKHGDKIDWYEIKENARKMLFYRVSRISFVWYRGDNYSEFVEEKIKCSKNMAIIMSDHTLPDSDIGGMDKPEYIAVNLISGPWDDSSGTLKCEWCGIRYSGPSRWAICTPDILDKNPRRTFPTIGEIRAMMGIRVD